MAIYQSLHQLSVLVANEVEILIRDGRPIKVGICVVSWVCVSSSFVHSRRRSMHKILNIKNAISRCIPKKGLTKCPPFGISYALF